MLSRERDKDLSWRRKDKNILGAADKVGLYQGSSRRDLWGTANSFARRKHLVVIAMTVANSEDDMITKSLLSKTSKILFAVP